MLQKQESCLASLDREVLLHLLALLATEWWIGEHDIDLILGLDVGDIFRQRIGVNDVGRFDAVQDHVHDGDDVGETFLFLAVEGAFLQRLQVSSFISLRAEKIECLA